MNRDDFPILDSDIIYFDNSATSLKPKCVIDKITEYYAKIKSLLEKNTESDKTDVDANDADTNDITDNSDGNGMVTE